MEEVIKYVVEVDTSRAEAKMSRVFPGGTGTGTGPAAAGGSPGAAPASPGRAPTPQEITDAMARAAAGGSASAANAWMKMNRTNGGQPDAEPTEPGEKAVTYTHRLLQKLTSRAAAAGLAGLNFAKSPGQFGAMAGVAMGGTAGVALAGISTIAEGMMNAAESLKNYSASLFGSMTRFSLGLEQLKWKLGAEVGDALARFMDQILKLAKAVEPLVAKLINLLAVGLEPVVWGLSKMADTLTVAVAALEVLVAWVDKKTGGEVGKLAWALQNPQAAGRFIGQAGTGVNPMPWSALFSGTEFKRWWSGKTGQAREGRYDEDLLRQAGGADFQRVAGILNGKEKAAAGDNLAKAMERLRESFDRLAGKLDESGVANPAAGLMYGLRGSFHHLPQVKPLEGFLRDVQPDLAGGMNNPAAAFIDRQRLNGAGGGANVTPAGFPLPQASPVNMHFNEQIEVRASDEDRLLGELLSWRSDLMARVRGAQDLRWIRLAAARGIGKAGMGLA